MSNYITYEERMEVENCLFNGKSFGEIAKVLGKDLSAKMTGLLKGTVNPEDSYNAYDIVSMFMELPERIGGIPEYLTEPFSKLCGSVPYVVSVPDLTPEPELYLM